MDGRERLQASTNEKFRQVLKLFYNTVYGNNEYYPEQVKWFSVKLGKEKVGKENEHGHGRAPGGRGKKYR